MVKATNRRLISLCIFLDFVIFSLSYNYDLLIYGLVAMALLTVGTYLYLASYATKTRKWQARLEAQIKELEADVYREDFDQESAKDEGSK